MMRAALVGTGTVVGVGVVLGLNPTGASTAALSIPLVAAGTPGSNGAAFGPVAPAGSASAPPATHPPSPTARPATAPSGRPSSAQHAARAVSSPSPSSSRTRAVATGPAAAPSPAPTHSTVPTATPTAHSTASASPTPAAHSATGPAVDVGYGQFGIIQVQATVSGGRLVDIEPVQLPDYEQTSVLISEQAWPILKQEALQAQSAQIANVTGASFTTAGFEQSLRAALLALGHSG
jgi:uncharacterized protein with FMN-binding domain